jgi:hypothetical protein
MATRREVLTTLAGTVAAIGTGAAVDDVRAGDAGTGEIAADDLAEARHQTISHPAAYRAILSLLAALEALDDLATDHAIAAGAETCSCDYCYLIRCNAFMVELAKCSLEGNVAWNDTLMSRDRRLCARRAANFDRVRAVVDARPCCCCGKRHD